MDPNTYGGTGEASRAGCTHRCNRLQAAGMIWDGQLGEHGVASRVNGDRLPRILSYEAGGQRGGSS
ncbi:hypothetical protein C7459_101271 [Tumebacillus permanentifrigoris]|uniref:Uncharacterized protein n=1 Tax=Tumebacillus permanentifrigoris TaxID=378543 RepID=A0A316DDU8_9BACL|nr:hypothetical protein C7459_101271 [Tumebacillus permanentifrigoris]